MNKSHNKIKVVFLDLDQTITVDTGSWLQFTALIGADPVVHSAIFERFKSGLLSYTDAKKELIELWRLTGKTNRQEITNVFEKIELRKGAVEAVSYLKTKYKLCIISGAIDIFVQVMAKKLQIEDKYSYTRFVFDQHDNLVDFEYTLSRGEEKLKAMKEFCLKYRINLKECAAIGDGDSDTLIFEEVALPILFIAKETTKDLQTRICNKLYNWDDIREIL